MDESLPLAIHSKVGPLLCIPLVQLEELGPVLIRYPEMHLLTLAAMLSLVLYRGRRLTQLRAFSWLNWPERPGS